MRLIGTGKTPNVALWAKLPDYEDWRLVIASDRLDQIIFTLGIHGNQRGIEEGWHSDPPKAVDFSPVHGQSVHSRSAPRLSPPQPTPTGCDWGARCLEIKYLEDAFVYRIR